MYGSKYLVRRGPGLAGILDDAKGAMAQPLFGGNVYEFGKVALALLVLGFAVRYISGRK